ncbi:MAG: hypothetical protein U0174_25940 [Polyangiaceae bacterium]
MPFLPAFRRALFLSAPLFLGAIFSGSAGCAADVQPDEALGDGNEIVDVPQTAVERQSIGNCWIYAEASWVESMNLTATGQAFDVSQSYWTYWHWFDQIAGSSGATAKAISTGGNFTTAGNIIRRYGLMAEKDFVPTDSDDEMSIRQKDALAAMNLSLSEGALKTPAARRNKQLVRAELDRAWRLSAEVSSALTKTFGADVSKTFASTSAASNSRGTNIIAPRAFPVAYSRSVGGAATRSTLLDAVNEWRQNSYSSGTTGRVLLQRVQRAMHDRQPILVSWFVDFNAMAESGSDRPGSFNLMTLNSHLSPGRQGGHMTVFEDYDATLADGTRLPAGSTLDPSNAADKAKLGRALDTGTTINFFRVKNSWGASRLDRSFAPGMPGYHDLYMDYLDGPIARCAQVNGETDTTNCTTKVTPLQYVILPPGY